MEAFRIGEVHEAVRDGVIPCEDNLRDGILKALSEYGTQEVRDKKGKVYGYWRKDDPLEIISEILADLETTVLTRKTQAQQPLNDQEWAYHRDLRVQMYRIKRAVRNILKRQEEP